MSIAWYATGALALNHSVPINVAVPPGTAENDLIICIVQSAIGGLVIPADNDWNILWEREWNPGIKHSIIYYRTATASEPATYTFSSATSWISGRMHVMRSTVGPIYVKDTNTNNVASYSVAGGSTELTFASVTAQYAGDALICLVYEPNNSFSGFIFDPPLGGHLAANKGIWAWNSIINGSFAAIETLAAAGATGFRTGNFGPTGAGVAIGISFILSENRADPPVEPPSEPEPPEIRIDWGLGDAYTDETQWVIQASGIHRIAPPEDSIVSSRGIISQATIILSNKDGRFSPLNEDSPIIDLIRDGAAYHSPVQIGVSTDGGVTYTRIFTGVAKIPVEAVAEPDRHPTVTVDCRGNEEKILYARTSTTREDFASYYDDGKTEAELIEAWLVAAGMGTADYNLDAGMFTIPWGWLDDESPIEDAWQLAAACGGRFRADVGGTLVYERMDHWLYGRSASNQKTYDESAYDGLEVWYNDNELYKQVTVEVSARQVDPTQIVWESDEQIIIPPGGTVTIDARFQQPIYSFGSVSYAPVTTGNVSLAGDVTVTSVVYAQRADLTITNANVTSAAILKKFYITGAPVVGIRGGETTKTTTSTFWTNRGSRSRALRGNPYIQANAQAEALASFLLDRYEEPTLFFRIRNAPGYPDLRLGDRIRIDNTPTFAVSQDCYVTAISWRLSNQGFYQDIEAVKAAHVFPLAIQYFRLDQDTLGTPTPTSPVFY